jgi:hypothetical protein
MMYARALEERMPSGRSPDAAMSNYELQALRRSSEGLPEAVSEHHGELLVRMGLAKINSNGKLELTADGARRLAAERA